MREHILLNTPHNLDRFECSSIHHEATGDPDATVLSIPDAMIAEEMKSQ
jgi:hypothetical protein